MVLPANEEIKGARDRMREDPSAVFSLRILAPIFEVNSRYNFHPLLAAHRAWLAMLAEQAIVAPERAAPIFDALDEIERFGPQSLEPFDPATEYYYLHMERALTQRVPGGETVVGNLNLGRTRPEPLARMVVRESILRIATHALELRRVLLERAKVEAGTIMPGYTHLQHAQPTTLGHYLLAVHDHVERDCKRLFAAYETTDRCTLGCGAMSGTSLPVDRDRVRKFLGFSALCENTIDSVSASDHVGESAAALTSLMTIIGRLAQDLYVWSSQEFAMIDVTDAFSSPSSLMPQKKNALVLEYVRSRTARTIGALTSAFTVMHNVGYMDTEEVEIETYRPLLDAIVLAEESVPTMTEVVKVMKPDRDLMLARTAWGFSSVTALAEAIHTHTDLSYRTAHRIVARSVLLASEAGRDASSIDTALLDKASQEILGRALRLPATAVNESIDPTHFVRIHSVVGGPSPAEVERMTGVRQERLASHAAAVAAHRATIEDGRKLLGGAIAAVRKAAS